VKNALYKCCLKLNAVFGYRTFIARCQYTCDCLDCQVELEVTLPSEGRDRTFKVAIKFMAQASLYALEEALDGRSQVVPADAVQALDVVMRHLPSMRY